MSRCKRQTCFTPFREEGQQKLSSSQILILGAGALGSHIVNQLAHIRAHHIAIVDMDIIEISSLHRQTPFDEEDAHTLISKIEVIKYKVSQVNINVNLTTYDLEVTSSNIESLIRNVGPDTIIDGMDNFKIRYLINEVCHKYQILWAYGAAVDSKGSVYGVDHQGPCLKCLLRAAPDTGGSCAINGVIPPIISMIASYKIAEAVRYLSGKGFSKQSTTIDAFNINYRPMNVDVPKNKDCPAYEKHEYTLLGSQQGRTIEDLCENAYLFRFPPKAFRHATHFPGNMVKSTSFAKLTQYQTYKFTLFKNGRMNAYSIHNDEETHHLCNTLLKSIH